MRDKDKNERRYASARERADKQASGFSASSLKIPEGVSMFKPKEGTMLLDILPYKAGDGNPYAEEGQLYYERTYWTHRGIGANGDTFVCPRKTANQPCPICERRAKLMKEGDDDNEELIQDLAPKQRQLFNVVNRKDPDKGVQLWDMSYFLFGKVLDARIRNSDEDDGYEKFFFAEGGSSLRIGFAEKTFGGHAFCEVESIDFKPRSDDLDEDLLEQALCLDDIPIIPDYDELKDTFLEAREAGKKKSDDDDDDDSGDEDEKPKRRRDDDDDDEEEPRKKRRDDDEPKSKKKSRDEDDDDEDDEPKKKKKPAPDDEDDDWGDFDKDDEDEDEGKKKKKSDDDDDSDDEEEPRKKKKSKSDDDDDEPKSKRHEDNGDDDDGWDDPEDTKKEIEKRKKRRDDDD